MILKTPDDVAARNATVGQIVMRQGSLTGCRTSTCRRAKVGTPYRLPACPTVCTLEAYPRPYPNIDIAVTGLLIPGDLGPGTNVAGAPFGPLLFLYEWTYLTATCFLYFSACVLDCAFFGIAGANSGYQYTDSPPTASACNNIGFKIPTGITLNGDLTISGGFSRLSDDGLHTMTVAFY